MIHLAKSPAIACTCRCDIAVERHFVALRLLFTVTCSVIVTEPMRPPRVLSAGPGNFRQGMVQFGTEDIMGIILWLIVGGVVGWLASIIMRTDAQQGIFLNIIVGIVGAFIGGLILSGGSINNAGLTLTSFLVSLVGAVILLAIVNLVRRGSVR